MIEFLNHTLTPALFFVFITCFLFAHAFFLKAPFLRAARLLRAYGTLTLRTNLLLYGLFAAGVLTGRLLPDQAHALGTLGADVVGRIGIHALTDPVSLAAGIFVWNFLSGTVLTLWLPGLLFPFFAPLVVAARFVTVGFMLSLASNAVLALHVPTILLELQAYVLMALAGLIALRQLNLPELMPQLRRLTVTDLLRRRPEALQALPLPTRKGLRDQAALLLLAADFLLAGALYEAYEVHTLIPHLTGH
ncbi:hypothetical protein [Deinococcus soli (ex Cha et al. 2016)]|uniref:Uncharacterized protein n=2 Tax=Deinococcus soli (ex Cha et al. 2016) TaxID=1309411 RepID=A0ACC6KFN9_9DEIO|nr:hypothetical protein [Deinococcus soli (ex Cha et al. 2016)]MDR6218357.1 hypothetical protein [Deinococcus soli (ex Cha et al. 2016)]MDR6329097.1 hypothetical protein [Deinococcus soli (ex Cha et al. 2016)]MDR6751370.1 hypothetical protein [Deinococcus soli (ex Cha et al. 2016)]